ncbi:MAG TPA: aminotransferase class I/II-fold pyridoxal phosphate-dependent enzyme [Polyangiaceae bacterium]|jgi:aromatic-L-amino-acid decarboxylase
MTEKHPLELDESELRAMIDRATHEIVRHVASLPKQPMHATSGAKKLARSLREAMPEQGGAFEDLLKQVFAIAPRSLNTASPGYLAYIPGGGLLHSAVADLVADAVNRYVGVWVAAPGLAQLEANVVDWFCEIVGYTRAPRPGGLLTTGGSLANLVALVTARENLLGEDFGRGAVYVSDQAHHSVLKAARFAGLRADQVRSIATDARFRLQVPALREAIANDARDGLTPFLIVAAAGTTNTGAIDPLPAIADLASKHRMWLHVDAAYGGFFALTARGKRALAGLDRADSIALDPHKSLFLPYGTGSLVVRDVETLKRAHGMHASYLPPKPDDVDFTDFSDLGPELSRDFRGLRVWLPMKMHGARAFRDALDEKLDLAREACDQIAAMPGVEIVAEPELSLFAFRIAPKRGQSDADVDALNRRFLREINRHQRVFLTGTIAHGHFVLRACILSFRTHADRIAMLVEDVRAALASASLRA